MKMTIINNYVYGLANWMYWSLTIIIVGLIPLLFWYSTYTNKWDSRFDFDFPTLVCFQSKPSGCSFPIFLIAAQNYSVAGCLSCGTTVPIALCLTYMELLLLEDGYLLFSNIFYIKQILSMLCCVLIDKGR